ncbi:MAG: hypothetical protein ABIT38_07330, partial [Gemmatimonadaceae bacterium]
HPGLAHYIIHAYDVPALAPLARQAAARYADIAPSAAHALHMPSHTFTRVGMWRESAATNLKSIESARASSSISEMLHASDYLMYAYLQLRSDSLAQRVLNGLPSLAEHFDPNPITGAAPGSAGIFALAAIPARWALERRDWKQAATLAPRTTTLGYADAVTYLTRALGAAHIGDSATARSSIDSLDAIRERLLGAQETYWGEQVAIQSLEARAALAFASGRREEATSLMREACTREDATEKSAVTPGPLAPAHELYGDMLLDANRSADALTEYRTTMTKEPGRFRTLYGALKAARATGDKAQAARYAQELQRLTGSKLYSE